MKEQSRANKLEKRAARGKAGATLGSQQATRRAWRESHNPHWGETGSSPAILPEQQEELIAANQAGTKGNKGKCKGK